LIDAFVPGAELRYETGPFFGPDGNLYVRNTSNFSAAAVLRYDGTTGAFIDQFVPYGSGELAGNLCFAFRNTDSTTLAYVAGSRLHITAAPTAVSGTAIDITITALDPNGNMDPAYQGTVTFSTTDPDSGVVLPADYTFTTGDGGDNGVHTFSGGVTLNTLGNQTLTVRDTGSGITGGLTIGVGPGP
jgi:hypothetical protein